MNMRERPDFSIGQTEAQLLNKLNILYNDAERTLKQWQDSGSQIVKQSYDEICLKLVDVQRALRRMNPRKYGRNHRVGQSQIEPFFTK